MRAKTNRLHATTGNKKFAEAETQKKVNKSASTEIECKGVFRCVTQTYIFSRGFAHYSMRLNYYYCSISQSDHSRRSKAERRRRSCGRTVQSLSTLANQCTSLSTLKDPESFEKKMKYSN